MNKKISLLIAILLCISLFLIGCSAKTSQNSNLSNDISQTYLETSNTAGTENKSGNVSDTKDPKEIPNENNIKKLVKNANVYIEVKNVDESLAKIYDWIGKNNGYEFSRNLTTTDNYKHISIIYKLQPEKLDGFLTFLSSTGKITKSEVKSDDITDQYYDASSRLDNLIKGREQLIEILKKAGTIDETLKVQAELNKISGEIEALAGKINMWNKLTAESTITLTINEESDPIKSAKSVSWKFSSVKDILITMKNGFILTTNFLVNIIIWIIIFIISLSPIIVIGFVILFLIKQRKKKRDKTL